MPLSVRKKLEEKLQKTFSPLYLKIEDDSHRHVGHAHYRPGGESHFSVTLVSDAFSGLGRIQRHRYVYTCLEGELKADVHALCLKVFSPQEWEALGESREADGVLGEEYPSETHE